MTRTEIEQMPSHLLSPTAKLVVEWLSRQPAKDFDAKIVGQALGMLHADVAGVALELRRAKLIVSASNPYGVMCLTPEARAAYATDATSNKKKASNA